MNKTSKPFLNKIALSQEQLFEIKESQKEITTEHFVEQIFLDFEFSKWLNNGNFSNSALTSKL